jgi:ATP synthase F1 delta subunit
MGFIQLDTNNLRVLLTSLPGRYAGALFNEGVRNSCLDIISINFSSLFDVFATIPGVKKFLTNYHVNKVELHEAWRSIGKHLSFCPTFSSLMWQIIVNKRSGIIKKVSNIYNIALAKHNNARELTITSSAPLSLQQEKRLESLISRIFKEKNDIHYEVNQKMLGGLKISSEGVVVDVSTLAQFNQFAEFCRNLDMVGVDYENCGN